MQSHRFYEDEGITLGLNLMGHDISYTVLAGDGTPILIAEEERYSRRKKGTFIPSPRQVLEVLQEAKVPAESVRHIAIANIPELLENRPEESRSDWNVPYRFGRAKCFSALVRALSTQLRDPDAVTWVRHHLCHAASAFLPSPFESAAVVTVDGMGEDETATIWFGNGSQLNKLFAIRYPHSLGCVYEAVSTWTGMTGQEREGKMMGLAAFGKPQFLEKFRSLFLCPDPKFGFAAADPLVSNPCDNGTWVAYCEKLFGPRRDPSAEVNQYHMDVAASVQALIEESLLNLLVIANRLTKAQYCCLSGGVFMNSMANGRLRRDGPFEDLWIQPMASDNGLSLGAALWSYARCNPDRKRWTMTNPFLGSEVTEDEILSLMRCSSITGRKSNCVEFEAAKMLAAGKLVGWVQGRAEVGARSLGHRSIFADPRDITSKDRLNTRIKHRENWRPFAPVVLEEDAPSFFSDARPSPFMMFVSNALPGNLIPAALHVDQTARVQTVSSNFDQRLHKLLCAFKELTGIGALVNTSFNLRGEPIVRTAEDAYIDFTKSGMDVLILGDYIFEKPGPSVDTNHLLTPPRRRIQVSEHLLQLIKPNQRRVIVSLGSPEFLEIVHSRFLNEFDLLLPLPPGKPDFRELVFPDHEVISLSDITSYSLLVVLLPIWIEVAMDLVPNLLAPFFEISRKSSDLKIVFADEAGGLIGLEDLRRSLRREDLLMPASEVENFWYFRRGEDKYQS